MVHALEEIGRVLTPGSRLVDLRPLASGCPLEVFVEGQAERAGEIDDSPAEPDDLASNAALREVVAAHLFEEEAKAFFDYAYYWNTLEQMMGYFDDHWSEHAILPGEVAQEAERLVKSKGFDSKLRARRRMVIATYRKL